MGITTSTASSGGQLHITLKLHEVHQLPGGLSPHVFGESPLAGAWDAGKSIPMEREDLSTWSLAFVLPASHEELKFKFLLKPRGVAHPTQLEEGPERSLRDGEMEGSATASFRLGPGRQVSGMESAPSTPKLGALLEFPVDVQVEKVSPFVLAANYKAMKERQQSRSLGVRRGVGAMALESTPENSLLSGGSSGDLSRFEVANNSSSPTYAANSAEEPRNLSRSVSAPHASRTKPKPAQDGLSDSEFRSRCVSIKDLVVLDSESVSEPPAVKSLSSAAPAIKSGVEQKPVFGPHKPSSGLSPTWVGTSLGESPKAREPTSARSSEDGGEMPDAAGAVAAAAIADRMLGPKERRQLAIILVGLPARGKTFTAAKLTRYLRWLGHDTKHFNVGKYRRLVHGANQSADFFRADNQEAVAARHQVAALAMEDMLAWMESGGQVGVFDATNSTRERRNMILRMAEGKCKVIFLETICTDPAIIDRNVREKVRSSPDYVSIADPEAAIRDFKGRIENYERAYEPVNEGSYVKLIDMASGSGGQMQINNISGYLPGRIVFFLVNTHLAPRPILITRHGESQDNVRERIGGDSFLSPNGEAYAKKLAEFVTKRLGSERAASIWTSTLQRTVQTGSFIQGFPRVQWRALDEINAGVCDGMTYAEIKEAMPEEYQARKLDKLRYRYPRGESYLDVIQRLEPVIIEIERQRSPVVVVAHQAVLRALYAYFMDKPLKEVPHIEMPLHTVIELSPGAGGVYEKRYKLMEAKGPDIP